MRQNNGAGHIIVMAFLLAITGMNGTSWLSDGLTADIQKQDGTIKIVDHELFARRDVSGAGGIYEFVNNRLDEAQGIVNFDKGRLNQNEAFIFDRIAINYASGAVDSVGTVTYREQLPGSLRNTEFEVKQNGRTVVIMPTAALSNPFNGGTSVGDNYTKLKSLAILDDVNQFTWNFEFPQGVSVPAGTGGGSDFSYVEVRFGGHKTLKKAA